MVFNFLELSNATSILVNEQLAPTFATALQPLQSLVRNQIVLCSLFFLLPNNKYDYNTQQNYYC